MLIQYSYRYNTGQKEIIVLCRKAYRQERLPKVKLYSSLILKDNKPEFGDDRRDEWQDHVTREISRHNYKDSKKLCK